MLRKYLLILALLIGLGPTSALYLFGIVLAPMLLTMALYSKYYLFVLLMFIVAGYSLLSLWVSFPTMIYHRQLERPRLWLLGAVLTLPSSAFWIVHTLLESPSAGTDINWALFYFFIFGAPLVLAVHLLWASLSGMHRRQQGIFSGIFSNQGK